MKLCTVFHRLAVGTVLFFGTLAVMLAADKTPPPDLIITNARVLVVDSNFSIAQAIAVRGDQIIAIGRNRQIEKLKGFDTRVIDAQEHTVMPGLYDNQVDSYHAAVSELNAPTPLFHSIAQALNYIRAQAEQKGTNTNAWITIDGAYPTRLKEGRLPTKAELDGAAPKNPVFWNCGPLVVVNSRALEICQISTTTTNPPGGEIVLDPETRKPSGLLRNATSILKLPPTAAQPTDEQRRQALKELYQRYNQQGITSIGEHGAEPEAINLFRDMAKTGELTVRINCARFVEPPQASTNDTTAAVLNALTNAPAGKLPYGPTGMGDDWVRIGPLLTRMDGDVLTATAYLRTPWGMGEVYQITEPAYRGQLDPDADTLGAFFVKAAKSGWQLSADCTGDAAMDQLLNCFDKVQFKTDIRRRRFLINHAAFQGVEDWQRCRDLGVAFEMQPSTLFCDGSSLLSSLGEKRLQHFEPFKTCFDQGLLVGGGSGHRARLDGLDSTDAWNPWLGFWITLARQTSRSEGIFVKEEQLSREQAVQFYTINNARLHFEDPRKGSLEVGKYADLILLDRDIMKCPVNDIRETKVQLTIVGGKVVWELPKEQQQTAKN